MGHLDGLKSQRRDVARVNGVGVHDDRFTEVDRFQKRVAEPFVIAGVSHQVGVRIDVEERIDLLAVGVHPALLPDAVGDESHVDLRIGDAFREQVHVIVALIARGMGDHQFGARFLESPHQFDGVLDAFARDDTGRLQNKDVVVAQPDFAAEIGVVIVDARRGHLKVVNVGNDCGREAEAAGEFLLAHRIDDDMLDARQGGGKGGLEIVVDGAAGEPFAFPGKIVMVRDGGQAGLSDDLGHRQPRNVHSAGRRVDGKRPRKSVGGWSDLLQHRQCAVQL